MPIFEYKDIKVEVDEDGFIQQPEQWNEEVAKALATTEDVDVTIGVTGAAIA